MELANLKSIIIADDHALFRQGLGLVLKGLAKRAKIVEAADLDQAMEAMNRKAATDLILLDLAMPGMDVGAGLSAFCRSASPTPVVILSAYQDRNAIEASVQAGARGYLLKSFSEDALRFALNLILAGEVYVPSSVMDRSRKLDTPFVPEILADRDDKTLSTLTRRQSDVLKLIMQGQSNKMIARELGILESTVKAHIQVILQKLNADNRTHAAMIARELIGPGDEAQSVNGQS